MLLRVFMWWGLFRLILCVRVFCQKRVLLVVDDNVPIVHFEQFIRFAFHLLA